MIALSPPFLVAAATALVALAALRRGASRAVVIFLAACAVSAAAVGLRYAMDAPATRLLQIVAAGWPAPLAYLAFAPLAGRRARWGWLLLGPLLVAAFGIGAVATRSAAFGWAFGLALDVALVAQFLGYGVALLRMAAPADALTAARLSEASSARLATRLAGALLVGSGLVDVAVAFDFFRFGGAHAGAIVGTAHLASLAALAAAALFADSTLVAGPGRETGETESASAPGEDELENVAQGENVDDAAGPATVADHANAGRIEALFDEMRLHLDPELSLKRLARRAGLPARAVSLAINRVHGRSVTQHVNARRVAEAARLLAETEIAVTQAMLESGFQSKSAFNREFRRVTGRTPSEWRRTAREDVSASEPSPES
jgi:AraC-like DNA-binding protein